MSTDLIPFIYERRQIAAAHPSFGDLRLPPRFWAKVAVDRAPGCWTWTGCHDPGGYGFFKTCTRGQKQMHRAHRYAYRVLVEEIPPGLQIDHLCRNRACVNPAHLEPVTGRTNKLRGNTVNRANAIKTHCIRGHAFDVVNTYVSPQGKRQCRTCESARRTRDRIARYIEANGTLQLPRQIGGGDAA